MRKYNVLVTATVLLIFAVIIAVMIGELASPSSGGTWDEITETVKDAPSDTVFEPILSETETEVITPDTEVIAPKMDGGTPETAQNVSESDFDAVYSDEDLLYLAKIVQNEAGSDYCTDEHQRYVASVVINRVNSPRFPGDTILKIALCGYGDGQPIQYMYSLDPNEGEAAFWQIVPSERAIQNARYVLENGVLDESVVWQANFEQGDGIVKEFTYPHADPPTTYICR